MNRKPSSTAGGYSPPRIYQQSPHKQFALRWSINSSFYVGEAVDYLRFSKEDI